MTRKSRILTKDHRARISAAQTLRWSNRRKAKQERLEELVADNLEKLLVNEISLQDFIKSITKGIQQ